MKSGAFQDTEKRGVYQDIPYRLDSVLAIGLHLPKRVPLR